MYMRTAQFLEQLRNNQPDLDTLVPECERVTSIENDGWMAALVATGRMERCGDRGTASGLPRRAQTACEAVVVGACAARVSSQLAYGHIDIVSPAAQDLPARYIDRGRAGSTISMVPERGIEAHAYRTNWRSFCATPGAVIGRSRFRARSDRGVIRRGAAKHPVDIDDVAAPGRRTRTTVAAAGIAYLVDSAAGCLKVPPAPTIAAGHDVAKEGRVAASGQHTFEEGNRRLEVGRTAENAIKLSDKRHLHRDSRRARPATHFDHGRPN
jgi:hypothetical protein